MRLRLITCEMFERELEAVVARSQNVIEVDLLPRGLHHLTSHELLRGIQSMVDRTDRTSFQACLLVCGSCQANLLGLQATTVPVVLPRARSCLALLLGKETLVPPQRAPQGARSPLPYRPTPPRVLDGQTHWIVPVRTPGTIRPAGFPRVEPSARLGEDGARFRLVRPALNNPMCHRSETLAFRPGFRPRRTLVAQREVLSVFELLAEGYWSYDKFLVIPVGWRMASRSGALVAEEISL